MPAPRNAKAVAMERSKRTKSVHSVADAVDFARSFAWKVTTSFWEPSIPAWFTYFLLIVEFILSIFIVKNVAYTEIDWEAYMSQAEGFLNGTLNYSKLEGGTGPLVYPAGFLYIYSILYYVTDHGRDVRLAQYIFVGIYVALLALVFRLYQRSLRVPPYVLLLMCLLSKRIHSIFMLRMFNDSIAMLLFFASANLFVDNRWLTGCLLYSSAVSVKMNILLFAPGLLFLLLRQGLKTTFVGLSICGLLQLILGLPFLLVDPIAYLTRSFDLKRQFFFKWTVNWRFIGEDLFLNRTFQLALLGLHLSLLAMLLVRIWLPLRRSVSRKDALGVNAKLLVLFTSNFVGILCSRSLHYQFYVWYFHTLHFLLWSLPMKTVLRLLVLGLIEMSWNTYPSTYASSLGLLLAHLAILASIIRLPNSDMVQIQGAPEKNKEKK